LVYGWVTFARASGLARTPAESASFGDLAPRASALSVRGRSRGMKSGHHVCRDDCGQNLSNSRVLGWTGLGVNGHGWRNLGVRSKLAGPSGSSINCAAATGLRLGALWHQCPCQAPKILAAGRLTAHLTE